MVFKLMKDRNRVSLRKSVLLKIAENHLTKLRFVAQIESVAEDFSKKIADYIRYSLELNHFEDRYELINKITEEIRTETNTIRTIRPSTLDSDDSGCDKGAKMVTLRIACGDEVQSTLSPNVLFEVHDQHRKLNYIYRLLFLLNINERKLREWGYRVDDEENDEETPGDNESSEESDEDSCAEDEVAGSCTAFGDASLFKITIPEFLASPNSTNFLELDTNKVKLLTEYIEKSESEEFIKNALFVLLTVSNLCENNQDVIKAQTTETAVELYSYLFDWASKNDRISLITNAILVQLRLIKAEEKSMLIECNEISYLYALQKAIEQSSSIPASSKDMFSIFLQRKKV